MVFNLGAPAAIAEVYPLYKRWSKHFIQTVFEGFHINTKEKLKETQNKYQLPIPFGHDVGNEKTGNRSSTMYHYKTGGTPWFIFIDQNNQVVFNDFHLDVDKTIEYLKSALEE